MDSKYQVFEGADEQFYWRLRAGNGEIVAQSEGYSRRVDVERAIEDFKSIANVAPIEGEDDEPAE